ncbi:MAG: hypothetical protein O3A87_04435 [Verrucomicrobia bacterium]|nr:hypothetical protein [Verrucomicrobiota bacterium]MDA1005714.1 hypothetical protein [Verrucomicrobiota bacterium]
MKPKTLLSLATLCCCATSIADEAANDDLVQGLVATYDDGGPTVSQVVMLPELGLAADESPHPVIKPSFTALYEGVLMVTLPGRYQFAGEGALWLDGKRVAGEIALKAGRHALRLSYERPAGAVSVGLSWQSDLFIKEPVPPTVLWHLKASTPTKTAREVVGNHPSPPFRIEQAMRSMKCASCHDSAFLATMHHKFSPDALLPHMRHANPMKWYGAMTGPLLEESDSLTRLADDLRKLPLPERRRGEAAVEPGKGLKMVATRDGLACIACHDIKHQRTAAESKGPNLSFITQRVSYDWFVRWMSNPQRLKPGVAMPAFFVAQPPEQQKQNIDALWDYLLQGDKMELPEELRIDPQQFVLRPTTKPMVNRVYFRLPDGRELLRAICVGLPNGTSYCFDAESCQLAYVWTGGYLDMSPHWKNKSLFPTPAVGEPFFLPSTQEGLHIDGQAPVFRGYDMVGGIPRFEFVYGDTLVRLLIDAPSPDQLRQSFTIGKRAGPVQFVGPPAGSDVSTTASVGEWSGDRLTISDIRQVELALDVKKGK